MNTKSLKATNIGPAESTKCLMIAIAWTNAAVAHIRASQDFILEVEQVSLVKGVYTFLKTIQIKVTSGQHLYFSRSTRDGFYYLNTETGCTCVGSTHFHQDCKHKQAVKASDTYGRKLDEVRKPSTEKECARCYQTISGEYQVKDGDNICASCIQAMEAEYAASAAPAEVQTAIADGVEALRTMSVGITPEMSREERAAAWLAWQKQQRRLKKQLRETVAA